MINFHPKKGNSTTSDVDNQIELQGGFADLIEVHTRTAIKNNLDISLKAFDELHKISLKIESSFISLDSSENIEGFRVLSAYGDDLTTSVFVNIWDAEGTSLVVANNQMHRVATEYALSHLVLEHNVDSYFIEPLMSENLYTQQLIELSHIATPYISKPSGNILHSILLENFAEYAESHLKFIPTDMKIFWRQPFKSFDIRGAFGNFIATPQWDLSKCSARFIITS